MRPKTFTLNPLLPDPDAFATKIQPTASGFILMTSGAAKTDGADRNAFCVAQTPDAAGELTMNGVEADKVLSTPRVVTIYATHDISGDTYVITGQDGNGEGLSESIAGPNNATIRSANVFSAVRHISTDTAATDIVEVGYQAVGTPSEAVRVVLTASQNEAGVGYTLHGVDNNGIYRSESGNLPNAGVGISNYNYSKIIGLELSSLTASIIQVGVATQLESKWYPVNRQAQNTLVDVHLSSSVDFTYSIQWTGEDIFSTEFTATRQLPSSPYVHTVTGPGSATTVSAYNNIPGPISAVRVAIDSFVTGGANIRIVQRGRD